LIRQQPVVEDGEIAAVIIDGKAMLKRVYYRDGKLILQSENPNYPPEIVTEGDVRIIGKLKKIVIDM
jgi:repressor LexA